MTVNRIAGVATILILFIAFSSTSSAIFGSSSATGTLYVAEDRFLDLDGSDLMQGNLRMNFFNLTGVNWIKGEVKIQSPRIESGIDSGGSGMKHLRTNKTIASGTTENVNISLPGSAFKSNKYTANCDMEGTDTELDDLNYLGISDRYPSTISLRIENTLVNSREITLHCIVIHD